MEDLQRKDTKICFITPIFLSYLIAGSIYFHQDYVERHQDDSRKNNIFGMTMLKNIQITLLVLFLLHLIFYYFNLVRKFQFSKDNKKYYMRNNLSFCLQMASLSLINANNATSFDNFSSWLIFYSMYYFLFALIRKRYLQFCRYKDYVFESVNDKNIKN